MSAQEARDLEPRIRETERHLAVVSSELKEVRRDVAELVPLNVAQEGLRGGLANVAQRLDGLTADVAKLTKALDSRDQASTEERKAVRVALIGLTGTILTALIAGLITLLASGVLS
jgi:hypothetical protein